MLVLARFSVRHPGIALAAGLIVTSAALPGVARLRLRTDGHALVPSDAPQVAVDARIRSEFGTRDPIVVLIETSHPEGIFNQATLRLVSTIDEAVKQLPGVEPQHVLSLASEHSDRVWPGTMNFRRFLEPIPETDEEMRRLRDDLDTLQLYTGTLLSRDHRAAAVMVGVPPGTTRQAFYGEVLRSVSSLGPVPDRVSVIGAPAAEALLGFHILEDLGVPERWIGLTTRGGPSPGGDASCLSRLRTWLGRHIGLVPCCMLVLGATFLLLFRSPTLMTFALAEIGAAIVFVFGVMGWLGIPVYLTTAVLPVILVATGVTDEIHLFERYMHYIRADDSPNGASRRLQRSAAASRAMNDLVSPSVKTSVTTIVGFLSFATSPMEVVRHFGLFTALGVLFCLFWSLTVIPALLCLAGPSASGEAVAERRTPHQPVESRGAAHRAWFVSWRWPILCSTIAVGAISAAGATRVFVQDSWIEGFARDSDFRRATERFNEGFLGTHLLQLRVAVDARPVVCGVLPATSVQADHVAVPWSVAGPIERLPNAWMKLSVRSPQASEADGACEQHALKPPTTWEAPVTGAVRKGDSVILASSRQRGSPRTALRVDPNDEVELVIVRRPMMEPATLQRLASFSAAIRARSDLTVGGVLGPAEYVQTMNFMTQGRKEPFRIIADAADRLEWLWAQYERIRGMERRRQLVTDDFSAGLITVFLKDANFADTARLMAVIRELEVDHLKAAGFSVEFAGDTAVSQTLIDAIVTTQVRSLLGSLLGTLLITTLLWRSLSLGLLSTIPCALAVLASFGVLGFSGIPLGVATSMFTAMTIGIGDDFAIHLLARYRKERSAGLDPRTATEQALRWEGRAIRWDALCVCLGLGALTLSQVPANARLGILVALSVATSLAATLLVLPAWLAGRRPPALTA